MLFAAYAPHPVHFEAYYRYNREYYVPLEHVDMSTCPMVFLEGLRHAAFAYRIQEMLTIKEETK